MDGMTLLQEARAAGLTVTRDGDRVRIEGPRAKNALARRLLERKSVIMHALRVDLLSAEWRAEYEERAAIREYEGLQERTIAEAAALGDVLLRMEEQAVTERE